MRFPEFLINLFTRYAPVDAQTLANLKIELMNYFNHVIGIVTEKENKNAPIIKRMAEIDEMLENLDEHTPEHEKLSFEWQGLKRKLENPTIMERIILFLEKPWVRVALLVSFVFISRWIMKKLTSEPDPEVKEPEPQPQQQYSNQYWQNGFQPYGYNNYPYPPNPQPPYPAHSQPRS